MNSKKGILLLKDDPFDVAAMSPEQGYLVTQHLYFKLAERNEMKTITTNSTRPRPVVFIVTGTHLVSRKK